MRFREFILNEDGLGDLGARMDRAFNHSLYHKFAGAYVSSDVSGSEQGETQGSAGHPLYMPSLDVTIPQVERTSRIKVFEYKKNPIYIELADGTRAMFTYDEYRRIQGTPEVGKVMTIIFQRHPGDRGPYYSKIERAIVLDN